MKQEIINVLNDTYTTGKPTKYQAAMHDSMADYIIDKLENGVSYSWGTRHWRKDDLTNYIWMNYSGGTTAEYAAGRMVVLAGITFKGDEKN